MTKQVSDFKHDFQKPTDDQRQEHRTMRPEVSTLSEWKVTDPTISFHVDVPDDHACMFPHPSYFVKAVVQWSNLLCWPRDITDSDVGVTWLELFVDFITATAVYLPVQRGKHRGYHLYESSGNGLVVDDLNTQIVVFRSCLKLVGALMQKPTYPQDRNINLCKSLSGFPGSRPTAGLRGRPKLVCQERTIQSLAKFFDNGAHVGSTTTWKGNFPFDRSDPAIYVSRLNQPDPPNLRRIATYISTLLKHKREQVAV